MKGHPAPVMMSAVIAVMMISGQRITDIGAEDDGDTDSKDAESEDDKEQDAEDGQHYLGATPPLQSFCGSCSDT